MKLTEKRKALIEEAAALASVFDDRDFTQAEINRAEEIYREVKDLNEKIAKAEKAASTIEALADDGTGTKGADMPEMSMWTTDVAETINGHPLGVKALLSGDISTPPAVEVVPLPIRPTRLIDLVPRVGQDQHTWSYLRQVGRDEDVQFVADNSEKPVSEYTFEEIEGRARVVAHLSEPFPLRYLSDHTTMVEILEDQMRSAIIRTIEHNIVHGDGTGEAWEGILYTTGVTAVEFAGDPLVTIRNARTRLEDLDESPTAWVLNPNDAASIEMTRIDEGDGTFLMQGGSMDVIFGEGITRISSRAVPEGLALLADWRQLRLRVREATSVLAATQAGDMWKQNQVQLRAEGRYGLDIRRPQAIAVVELAPGGSE